MVPIRRINPDSGEFGRICWQAFPGTAREGVGQPILRVKPGMGKRLQMPSPAGRGRFK